MYIDLLKQRLLEQQEVYRSLKAKKVDEVCYKEYKHKEYGTQDANYRNRMRLVYYLLYEKIMDEDVIVYLFQEELRDRENNSLLFIHKLDTCCQAMCQEHRRVKNPAFRRRRIQNRLDFVTVSTEV